MEKIILVVFKDDKPWQVTTIEENLNYENTYDIDYCKRDGELYYSMSGYGYINNNEIFVDGDSDFWLENGFEACFNPGVNGGKRLNEIDPKWRQHPSEYAQESGTVYCNKCEDFLPDDGDEPCEHVRWDDDRGWWAGEGYE